MKIDLGCGLYKSDGFVGVDVMDHPNVDVVHDLNSFPYPFSDSSVEFVRAFHVLEHVDHFVETIEELWRICEDRAIIEIRCPHASCIPTMWADPTHKKPFVMHSFLHWGKESNHIYGFNAELEVDVVRLHYCLYEGERLGKALTSKKMKNLGKLIDKFVNKNSRRQQLLERFLSH